MLVYDLIEPAIFLACLSLFFGYHYLLYCRYVKEPLSTTVGQNHQARRLWCQMIRKDKSYTLAVQTIRNSMMATSLFASTSLTLSAVVAAYVFNSVQPDRHGGLDFLGSSLILPIHKFFAVTFCFTISFYCYVQCVRTSSHASYMINIDSPEAIASLVLDPFRMLERGANFHTIGTRLFYLAFLLMIWIFGPVPFAVLTIALVWNLWHLDSVDGQIYQQVLQSQVTLNASSSDDASISIRIQKQAP